MNFDIMKKTLDRNSGVFPDAKQEVIDTIIIEDNDLETLSTNSTSSNFESPSSDLQQNSIETIEIDDDCSEHLNNEIFNDWADNSKVSCKVCNFKAKHSQQLVNHLIDIHTSKFISCNECDFKGSTLNSLAQHWLSFHGALTKKSTVSYNNSELLAVSFAQKYLLCTVCNYKTIFKNNLIDHLIETHTNKIFICDICSFTGENSDALNKHKEDIHSKRNCPPIIDIFSEKDTDESDSQNNYKYECQRCKYKTNMKIALIRHMYSVHRRIWVNDSPKAVPNVPVEKNYTFFCNFCNFKTDCKNDLYLHKESVHKDGKIFLCTHCRFKSPSITVLNSHMLEKHAYSPLFSCSTCNYVGNTESDLNFHILKNHISEKNYICSQCSYTTKSENDLKDHLNAHNIPKCKICNFISSDETNLHRHILLAHVSGKPFTCKYCEHYTTERTNFYEHVLLNHSIPKSFPCRLCNNVAETENEFDSHLIEAHDKEFQFSCDRCKFRTNVKTELTLHLQMLHGFEKASLSNKVIMVKVDNPNLKHFLFSCDKCQFRTNFKNSLTKHILQFHKPEAADINVKLGKVIMGDVFVCNICGFKTIGEIQLKEHELTSHPACAGKTDQSRGNVLFRIFSCGFCDYKTDQEKDLDKHRKKFHSVEGNYTTVIFCDENKLNDLCEDIQKAPNESVDGHFNQICISNQVSIKEGNNENSDFNGDNINLNKTKDFEHNIIENNLIKLETVKNEIRESPQENNVEIFSCRGCDFKTNKESDLYPHVLEVHMNSIQTTNRNLFNCNFCDFITDKESDLEKHSLKHQISKNNSVREEQDDKDEIIILDDDDDDDDNIFCCSFCKFKTTENKYLNSHIIMAHKVNSSEGEIITIDDEEDVENCINVTLSSEENTANNLTKEIDTVKNDSIKHEVSIKTEFVVEQLEMGCSNIKNEMAIKEEDEIEEITFEETKGIFVKTNDLIGFRELHDSEVENARRSGSSRRLAKTCQVEVTIQKGDYSCASCQFKTNDGRILEMHVKKFHNFEPIPEKKRKIVDTSCSLCNFKTSNTRDMNVHIISNHWKQEVLFCDECEYLTSKKDELSEHKKDCHKNKQNKVFCSVCKYQANNKKELDEHLIYCRKSSDTFCCSYCKFKTSTKVDLMIHTNGHKRNNRFNCNHCDFHTSQQRYLNKHIRDNHTKYYRCSYCNFKTRVINNLEIHVLSLHKKKKCFICDLCNHKTRLKKTLKKHLQLKHEQLF